MKINIKHSILASLMIAVVPVSAGTKCLTAYNDTIKAVAANKSSVLELVSAGVAQNESCACEIVKAAIVASDANKHKVGQIVDAAITSAPSKIRVIGQCAVAVAPDAHSQVQDVVNRHTGNSNTESYSSDYSAKGGSDDFSGKGGRAANDNSTPPSASNNPLDFPGAALGGNLGGNSGGNSGFAGPALGQTGGSVLVPSTFQVIPPTLGPPAGAPIGTPPVATEE